MKSEAQHQSEQLLDQTSDTANRGAALTTMADEPVAQLRALVGIGHAILAPTEELRETRRAVENVPTRAANR